MKQGGNNQYGWRKKRIKTGYLLAILLVGVVSSAYFLRQNNLKMVELRDAVGDADKSGKNLEQAIENLNAHIFTHMNTTTVRPIELVNTYNRQAEAAIRAANSSSKKDVYKEAAAACEQRGVPLTSIAQCAAEYATQNSPDVGPQKIQLPDKNLFTYSFVSPRWTPDLAGWSVLFTVVILVWLIARLGEYILIRLTVRKRLRGQVIENNS